MIDNVLKNRSIQLKISIKGLFSILLVLAAAFLPLAVHSVVGVSGGIQWLPMYLPVLLGGCILGCKYALVIGALSPIASFFISRAIIGTSMPIAAKLPFMVAELIVFGVVSGLFYKKISCNPAFSFLAVVCAFAIGRASYLALSLISGANITALLNGIALGWKGAVAAVVTIPLAVALFYKLLKKEND